MRKFEIHPDIAKAKTLHADFYTDSKIFEESKEKIFSKTMHFLGDMSLIPEQNSLHPVTILPDFLDESLLPVRDDKNEIRCLSNV